MKKALLFCLALCTTQAAFASPWYSYHYNPMNYLSSAGGWIREHTALSTAALLAGLASYYYFIRKKPPLSEAEIQANINKIKNNNIISNFDSAYEEKMAKLVTSHDKYGQRFWRKRLERQASLKESPQMRKNAKTGNELADKAIEVFEKHYPEKYDPDNPAPFFELLYKIPDQSRENFFEEGKRLTQNIVQDILQGIPAEEVTKLFDIQKNDLDLVKLRKILNVINQYKHLIAIKKLETLQEYVYMLAFRHNLPKPYNIFDDLYAQGNFLEFMIQKEKWSDWLAKSNGQSKMFDFAAYQREL